jgi:hypothetical protein
MTMTINFFEKCQLCLNQTTIVHRLYVQKQSPEAMNSSMTRLPKRFQPPVVVRQRSQKPSKHRHGRDSPKLRIRKAYRLVYKAQRHQILRELHRQHGNEAHTTRRANGSGPSQPVFAKTQ